MKESAPKRKKSPLRETIKAMMIAGSVGTPLIGDYAYNKRDLVIERTQQRAIESDAQVRASLESIESTYGIRVVLGESLRFGANESGVLTLEEARNSLEGLGRILSKYPPGFFREHGLEEVHLHKDTRAFLEDLRGNGDSSSAGNFQPLHPSSIVVQISPYHAAFESTFDHELFHLLDHRHRAEVESYEALRATGFFDRIPHEEATSAYGAEAGATEDRAELASLLLFPDGHRMLLQNIALEEDPEVRERLREKMEAMKALYYSWSGGAMDDAFWEGLLEHGDNPEAYNMAHGYGDSWTYFGHPYQPGQ